MKNMFNNTDLNVFYVIHKLVEHSKWTEIDPRVIKAYTWLMYMTNTQESVTHDLTDKVFSAAVGVSEDYIGSKLRAALADLGLVGYVKNQRGRGYKYFVLDPDTGHVIDPSPFNAAKLSVDQIRRYYRASLERLGMTVTGEDKRRNGHTLLVSTCPLCRKNTAKPYFEVKLDEQGEWICFDCNRYGNMLQFEMEFHEQFKGRKLYQNQAAVKLSRFLKHLDKSAAVAAPVSDEEVKAALAAD